MDSIMKLRVIAATLLAATLLVGCGSKESGEKLTGKAQGFGGEVTVEVTVDGDKITAVTATGDSETEGIGSKAIEELPGKIVEANSADVEVVSGATVTSTAIIDAVKSALESK